MNNPHEILGVNQNASQEEIRKAYKELAKKYHPDKYSDNPLQELADTKMRQINAAYDELSKKQTAYANSSQPNYNHQSRYAYSTGGSGGNGTNSFYEKKKWPKHYYAIIGGIIVLTFLASFLYSNFVNGQSDEYMYDDSYVYSDEYGSYEEPPYGEGYPEESHPEDGDGQGQGPGGDPYESTEGGIDSSDT